MKSDRNNGNDSDYEEISTMAPQVFVRLAHYFHQSPEYLAALLLQNFCENLSHSITIVSHERA